MESIYSAFAHSSKPFDTHYYPDRSGINLKPSQPINRSVKLASSSHGLVALSPLSILLLVAIGAKLVVRNDGRQVGKCRVFGAPINSNLIELFKKYVKDKEFMDWWCLICSQSMVMTALMKLIYICAPF